MPTSVKNRVKGTPCVVKRQGSAGIRRVGTRLFRLLPLVALITYILATEPLGFALFFFSSVALHECGHLFAFLLLRQPAPAFRARRFGLLLTPKSTLLSYGQELFICAAGPLFNLLACAALLPALRAGGAGEANFCFFALNLLNALFNLLPIAGFDGGRMLSAALSLLLPKAAADRISAAISFFSVLFLYFAAIYIFFFLNSPPYFLLLSFFLLASECRRNREIFGDFARFSEKTGDFQKIGQASSPRRA